MMEVASTRGYRAPLLRSVSSRFIPPPGPWLENEQVVLAARHGGDFYPIGPIFGLAGDNQATGVAIAENGSGQAGTRCRSSCRYRKLPQIAIERSRSRTWNTSSRSRDQRKMPRFSGSAFFASFFQRSTVIAARHLPRTKRCAKKSYPSDRTWVYSSQKIAKRPFTLRFRFIRHHGLPRLDVEPGVMRLAGFFQHQTQRLDHAAHGELRPAQANGHSRPELNLDATQPHRLGRAVAFFLAVAFNLLPGRSGQGHRQRFESLIGGQLADAIDRTGDLPHAK